MKPYLVPAAMVAHLVLVAGCSHTPAAGGGRSDAATRLNTAAPTDRDDLAIAAIEASVDTALTPLSEVAPVRLTPVQPAVASAPAAPQRSCWAREATPAVYEQVMGEVQVVQAEIAPDGTVLRPPIYRKAPVPRVVRPRAEIKFEAPCPEQLTPEFISSLQRALAARGYFAGNVTGRLDAPTAAALRKYQEERGLASAQLSLETARSLGLVAVSQTKG
ncbi:peptidoglycan-binding domain-containing protein [Tropicibacter oceani]|uniref:Peptidoglycan-binding domain-containing protein n=1 Tax=Tropicibacter oceani TaxID=3058420 RepID=A0ABY8QCK1_9RHOB|nr:peptidoglycan-binding domain-containing protein [Tropicibacter oceani]WGW02280.1 peptidoglycan-binding domain-containing protein [Tropicibacter oceani]